MKERIVIALCACVFTEAFYMLVTERPGWGWILLAAAIPAMGRELTRE